MIIGLTKSKTRCNLYFKGETGVEYIKKLGESDTTNLAYDDTDDNNLRYIGANPNNYVRFNDELWRIIGVLKVKTENGTTEERLKIIRTNGIEGQKDFTKFSWDYKLTNVGSSTSEYGSNDWTDSQLKDMLNGIYYNSTSGDCYFGKSEASQCDFSGNSNLPRGLNAKSRAMIDDNVIWSLGGFNTADVTAKAMYGYERENRIYSNRVNEWSKTTDVGNMHNGVGLLYPSDYGYAVGGNEKSNCLLKNISDYHNGKCRENDWLYTKDYEWTITPISTLASVLFGINSGGYIYDNYYAYGTLGVMPVVYLKSDVRITSGTGEVNSPYVLYYDEPLTEYIEDQAKVDLTNLAYDDTKDKNLRYIGSSPNNYVDIGDRDSDGNPILWRIIGVMNNITNFNDGEKQESLVKIIRADIIGSYSWDNSPLDVNSGNGVNEWSQADVMKLLNPKEAYLDNPTIGASLYWNKESGNCYKGTVGNNTACDFTSSGLSDGAKLKFTKARWNTGTYETYDDLNNIPSASYEAERSNNTGKICDFSNLCNDEVERTTTWDGYLALMYPSDFGYAVGGETRNDCLMQSLYNWDLEICKKNDWILLPSNQWTITPVPVSFLAYSAVYINSKLQESNTHVHIAHAIRPAGYLKSTTKIIENDKENYGSKENPFIIY